MTKLAVLSAIGFAYIANANVSDPFSYACDYAYTFYGAECGDLKPPVLVVTKAVGWQYRGFYYPGEPYIFISARLSPEQQKKTALHETMHYVLDHTKASVDRCESEEAARRVTALYFHYKYDEEWRKQYRC